VQTHTHELTMTDNEVSKRFVSWSQGEAEREWACLRVVWENAPGIAPRPLRREVEDGHPVVVMQRIAGVPLGGRPLTTRQTGSLGRTLRTLYDIPVEEAVAAGLTERRYGPTSLPDMLQTWLGDDYDLTACRQPELVGQGVRAALAWLRRSDRLPDPTLGVLGIADLNPANVLWDGQTCRLVDFEDGGLSDPGYELADHVEHLAARTAGTYDAAGLAQAADLSVAEQERMRAYRPLWAIFWLAMLLPGNGGFHRNPPGTTEAQVLHLQSLTE
jgi:aminoglycoside phosphotransferase